MKRHPALRDLSSDHHLGLVQARRLVKAVGTASETDGPEAAVGKTRETAGVAQVAGDFLAFWAEHTTRHFREEEEVLLPAFARYGDPSQAPIAQLLVEHVHIRRLVSDLQHQLDTDQPSLETIGAIGELLRAHIKHEEDVVFPLIESVMPEEALQELASRLSAYAEGT